tara:strand:- start:87 stop:356 length:270 start_codon:yes stop_codon:yes gene_type:complete
MNPIIHDWSIIGSCYQAPEIREMKITGKVYDDPRFIDGEPITTSVVQASMNNTVETQNSVYDLGRISEEYLEWCFNNGIVIDPTAPVKF